MKSVNYSKEGLGDLATAMARILIASYFISVSLGFVLDPNGFIKHEALTTMPNYLRWPNSAFELVAAISILVGFQTRMAVALLALYVFWSSFIFNYVPGNSAAIGAFWRDLAMIGGLLMLFAHGTGRFSLDYYLNRQQQPDQDEPEPDVVNMADIARAEKPLEAPMMINA